MSKLILSILFGAISLSGMKQANFAQDIHVTATNGFDCKNERVSVAYNGDIYIGRIKKHPDDVNYFSWEIIKSTDNGSTWTTFAAPSLVFLGNKFTSFDMIVAGNVTANNFRIFVVMGRVNSTNTATLNAYSYDESGNRTSLSFDGESYTTSAVNGGFKSVSLASDWKQKNSNATNYTISCAVLKVNESSDSIIGFTTQSSLVNFNRRGFYRTISYIKSVSAAVGSCSSSNSSFGRLGIVWDEFPNSDSEYGIIKAYFSRPDSPSLSGTGIGIHTIDGPNFWYRNPSIAMSQEANENDIRTAITYEVSGTSGYYRILQKKSNSLISNPPVFNDFVFISPANHNSYTPHVVYDHVYNNFLHTYYNSTVKTIPYKLTSLNSSPTAEPAVFSGNIRDASSNISDVYPRVDFSNSSAKAVFIWNDEKRTYLDYETSILGIEEESNETFSSIVAFPNPTIDHLTMSFDSKGNYNIDFVIIDITGREIQQEEKTVQIGKNNITLNTSNLENGQYILLISSPSERKTIHFIKGNQ